FPKATGIVTASVCKKCGLLAIEGLCDHDPRGSMVVEEYFVEGTEPTESCTCHVDSEGEVRQVLPEGASTGTADDPYLLNRPMTVDEDGNPVYPEARPAEDFNFNGSPEHASPEHASPANNNTNNNGNNNNTNTQQQSQ
ncbi:MAG: hypothetical protein IKZ65_08775, partial [Lachnospiraceae bacterium]|nr:hypothetical protein [Lachnospiraceae bacterium]